MLKYRGPILRVTSQALGSDDLTLDQSATSIQILPEPALVTWHIVFMKIASNLKFSGLSGHKSSVQFIESAQMTQTPVSTIPAKKVTWLERFYNSCYSNGVPVMFIS